MITSEQIKAARALLRLEQEELARRAGVSVSTIRRLEAAGGADLVAPETAALVVTSLQEAGVDFIHHGVALNPRPQEAALLARLRAIAARAGEQAANGTWLNEAELYGDDGLPK